MRRLMEITDVARSKGLGAFSPLMAYDVVSDVTRDAPGLRASERVGAIAGAWSLSYDEALENIRVRAAIRKTMVDRARSGRSELLGAAWVAKANATYWGLVEEGAAGSELLRSWTTWFLGASHA